MAFHEPRSVAVPAASCGGVPPPARTPGETPGELAGEDACATFAGRFMASTREFEIVEAFDEPSLVWSSAFRRLGVAPAKAGTPNTALFMAPTHVNILEVFPLHQPERGL